MKWIRLSRSKIKVSGKPAKVLMKGMTAPEEHTHFLHSLLTNNIKALKEGNLNYNLWLRPNGQPVGDFFVFRFRDHFLLDTEEKAERVIEEFEKLKLSLRVEFENLSDKLGHIFLFGEGATDFIKDTFGLDLENMSFKDVGGLIVARNPLRVGEDGFDLIGDRDTLERHIPHKGEVSLQEFEDTRIRNCVPKIGKELREGFSPLEAGVLSYAIDMNKGCYVGQEAIARVYFRGRTPRVLVRLEIEGDVAEGDKLMEGEKAVGMVTSVDSSGKLGLGYVLRSSYEAGKELKARGGKVRVGKPCEKET